MKGSYMKNNILMPTDYEAPVERLEKIQHLKTKARKANNPHGLPLMSICTLVHIFQDTFFFNKHRIRLYATFSLVLLVLNKNIQLHYE